MSNPLAGWAAANRSEGYAPPFGGSGRVRVTFHDFTPHSDDRALRAPKPLAHRQHCRAYGNRTLCALQPRKPHIGGRLACSGSSPPRGGIYSRGKYWRTWNHDVIRIYGLVAPFPRVGSRWALRMVKIVTPS
jgi:hypothetical protein